MEDDKSEVQRGERKNVGDKRNLEGNREVK